jgi:hypothetical protein
MYKVYDNVIGAKEKKLRCREFLQYICLCLIMLSMIIHVYISGFFPLLIVYFFCRLKINHDSHEFILEFSTVANSDGFMWCCTESLNYT